MKLLLPPHLAAAAMLFITAGAHAQPPTEMLQAYSAQASAAAPAGAGPPVL